MVKKMTEYLCPACGDTEEVEITDTEIDDSSLSCKCSCAKCGAMWQEYFELRYNGYANKGIDYKANGKEMFP